MFLCHLCQEVMEHGRGPATGIHVIVCRACARFAIGQTEDDVYDNYFQGDSHHLSNYGVIHRTTLLSDRITLKRGQWANE